MRAEELPGELGRFRVVTFAQSFHWFDRPRVARAVHRMLEPGGACVLVHATTHRGLPGEEALRHPRPPTSARSAAPVAARSRLEHRPARTASCAPPASAGRPASSSTPAP
jgi:hypothetical protein